MRKANKRKYKVEARLNRGSARFGARSLDPVGEGLGEIRYERMKEEMVLSKTWRSCEREQDLSCSFFGRGWRYDVTVHKNAKTSLEPLNSLGNSEFVLTSSKRHHDTLDCKGRVHSISLRNGRTAEHEVASFFSDEDTKNFARYEQEVLHLRPRKKKL